jgi:hypothetical protein
VSVGENDGSERLWGLRRVVFVGVAGDYWESENVPEV